MLEARSDAHPAAADPALADLTGVGLALLSAAASGTLSLWGKLAMALHLTTPTLLSFRFGLTAALLLAVGRFRISARERGALLLLGALYTASTVAYFAALSRISASTAALLVYVAPAFVILYGALTRVRPSRPQLAALLCTLAGLVAAVGLPGEADRDLAGLLLGGLSGALYGAYLFASDRLARAASPLAVTAHIALVCAVLFTALGATSGQLSIPTTAPHWAVILAILLIPTLIAIPALTGAVQRIGAARVSMLATTEPLWAVLFATLFLGEVLHASQILAGGLILAGATIAQVTPRHKGAPRP